MYRFFLPHLRIWNSIDLNYRNISTYSGFKRTLINKMNVNMWHCFGKKILNIIQTNLRHRYNSLKYDVYRCYLKNEPNCIASFLSRLCCVLNREATNTNL